VRKVAPPVIQATARTRPLDQRVFRGVSVVFDTRATIRGLVRGLVIGAA
jgi:hypothetical protein